jgi:hypothetical protein
MAASKISWFSILGLFLGTAETIVPIFIHNPQSQQVEGVIMTSTNNLFTTILQLQQQANTAATAPGAETKAATPADAQSTV